MVNYQIRKLKNTTEQTMFKYNSSLRNLKVTEIKLNLKDVMMKNRMV